MRHWQRSSALATAASNASVEPGTGGRVEAQAEASAARTRIPEKPTRGRGLRMPLDLDRFVDPPHEPGEHVPRPDLDGAIHAFSRQTLHALDPSHRRID